MSGPPGCRLCGCGSRGGTRIAQDTGRDCYGPWGSAFASHLGALHSGALPGPAGHLATVAHAEPAGRALPHFILVAHDPVLRAASRRRHALLTASPGPPRPALTLRKQRGWRKGASRGQWGRRTEKAKPYAAPSLYRPAYPGGGSFLSTAALLRRKQVFPISTDYF